MRVGKIILRFNYTIVRVNGVLLVFKGVGGREITWNVRSVLYILYEVRVQLVFYSRLYTRRAN